MRETIAGIFLLISVIGVCLFLGRNIRPNLQSGGEYEPCQTGGHPLYTDC